MLAQRKEKYYYENRHKKSIPMLVVKILIIFYDINVFAHFHQYFCAIIVDTISIYYIGWR